MTWIYNDKILLIEDIPEKAIGFIYLIENLSNNKKYIGKKLLTKASYKQKNGKKIKCRTESNWQIYNGSCKELLKDISDIGEKNFQKSILKFTFSLPYHNYLEQKYQFVLEVLEKEDYYNENINMKILKKNIINHS